MTEKLLANTLSCSAFFLQEIEELGFTHQEKEQLEEQLEEKLDEGKVILVVKNYTEQINL